MTPEETTNVVRALFGAWNRQAGTDTFRAFALAIGDLDSETATTGLQRAIRAGGEHPPSAGDFRKLCLGESDSDLRASAMVAWNRVTLAVRKYGDSFHPRQFGDPLTTHAIGAIGGWQVFCFSPPDKWQQRTFIEAYMQAGSSPQEREAARLSHEGKPVGALADARKAMAESLRLTDATAAREASELTEE